MSVRFTGDKTALRRVTALPAAHDAFTVVFCAKLLTAAPARTATLVYTQTGDGASAETAVLAGTGGNELQAGDDYGSTYSATVATVTAGGAAGANWFGAALQGRGSGAGGLRIYHKPIGSGTLQYQSVTNTAGNKSFSTLQFGDLPFGSTYWFDGLMAHLRVYDAVLTDAEIQAEIDSPTPVRTASLLSYHSFANSDIAVAVVPDQGSGTFTYFTAAPSTSTDMPVYGPTLTIDDTLPLYGGPTWAPAAQQTAFIGVPFAFAPTLASGASGAGFEKVSGPTWATVNQATGVVSGTPTGVPAIENLIVRATNPGGSADLTIVIDVQRVQVPQPPTPTVPATASAPQGAMVAPRVPMVDDAGLVAREWWRLFARIVADLQTALARAPQRLGGATLTADAASIYRSPPDAASIVSAITITNPTAAAVAVSAWIVPNGSAPGSGNAVLLQYVLAAGASESVPAAAGQVVPASGEVYALGAGVLFVLTGSVQA